MSAGQNKATARRIIDEVINGRSLDVIDDIVADDFISHTPQPGGRADRAGLRAMVSDMVSAFPDLRYVIESEVAQGDTVVHRVTPTGTQHGQLWGMPSKGKRATWQEMHIWKFGVDGLIAQHWGLIDLPLMMMQLQLMPELGA